jgi:GT2 family glycosyltransferase
VYSSLRRAPAVSIVVVNYNGVRHLPSCLDSVAELEYPRDELDVIVVDNASTDGSRELLRQRYPWVRVFAQERNLGFGGGNNVAAELAQGRRLVFLNNDMRVDPSFVTELERALDETGAACAGARILDWTGLKVDFAGAGLHFSGFAYQVGYRREARNVAAGEIRPIIFACGGAMMIERDVYLDVGGFDGDYFATYEDSDLGWRLWILGHRVVLAPAAVVYHRHHGTLSVVSEHRRDVLYRRNALVSAIKNYEEANLRRVLPAALFGTLAGIGEGVALRGLRTLERPVRTSDKTHVPGRKTGHVFLSPSEVSTLVALEHVAAALPRVLEKRALVQQRRQRTDAEVAPLFGTPFGRWPDVGPPTQYRVAAAFGVQEIFAQVARKIAVVARPGDERAGEIANGLRACGHDVHEVAAQGRARTVAQELFDVDPHILVVRGVAVLATLLPAGLWMPIVVDLDERAATRGRKALDSLRGFGRADALIMPARQPDIERLLARAGWSARDLERQVLGIGDSPERIVRVLDEFSRRPVMRTGDHDEVAAWAAGGALAKAHRAYQLGGPGYAMRLTGAYIRRRVRARLVR